MKAFVSIIIGAIGLLMSSCGLLFLGLSIPRGRGAGIWPIAVPSVIAGGLLLWGAVALWRSWRKSTKAATTEPPPDNAAPPN